MNKSTLSRVFRGFSALLAITPVAVFAATGCAAGEGAEDDGMEVVSSDDSAISGLNSVHTGEGTYYATVDTNGHCSFGNGTSTLFGAMNHTDYENSAACGMCARITGPNGSVKVKITNECPECAPGDIDLSQDAFTKLAPLSKGRIPISWVYERCDTTGPLVYHYKDGTHQYWNAVQIRNSKTGIAKLEAQVNGQFISLPRESYNYFIANSGLGPGPYTFRITDVYGAVITESGVPFKANADVPSPGSKQFP